MTSLVYWVLALKVLSQGCRLRGWYWHTWWPGLSVCPFTVCTCPCKFGCAMPGLVWFTVPSVVPVIASIYLFTSSSTRSLCWEQTSPRCHSRSFLSCFLASPLAPPWDHSSSRQWICGCFSRAIVDWLKPLWCLFSGSPAGWRWAVCWLSPALILLIMLLCLKLIQYSPYSIPMININKPWNQYLIPTAHFLTSKPCNS